MTDNYKDVRKERRKLGRKEGMTQKENRVSRKTK